MTNLKMAEDIKVRFWSKKKIDLFVTSQLVDISIHRPLFLTFNIGEIINIKKNCINKVNNYKIII